MLTHPQPRSSRADAVRPRRAILSLTLVSFLAIGLAACGNERGAATSTPLPALTRLQATRGANPGVYDSEGRQVLLRGINVNALGDYYQANAAYPPIIPLDPDEFEQMARHGFNVIRLIVSWSALEPERDRIDYDYIARIRDVVAAAKAAGIYTVLDMHQDAWGKYIASPEGISCGSREAAIGWDGAPEWATITGGVSTCRVPGSRELSPAVIAAFSNFYVDRDGIQTQLVKTWAALAAAFADEPAVAGYDLLNEPHFGASPLDPSPLLGDYETRAIDAIRAAERGAGGFEHIVFFEPVVTWPVTGTSVQPDFTADTNIVFAPHNYAESITGLNSFTIEQNFAHAVTSAAGYQTTFWIGEYGWFSDPPVNKARLLRYAREEDRLLIGSAWWQWEQACGDPHSIGVPNGEPRSELIHFNRTGCPGDIDLGPVPEWAIVLSRPYPRAAPGRLLSLESDGDTRRMRLTGVADHATAGAQLDLWVPAGAAAPVVTGATSIEVIQVAGGYRVFADVAGDYEINVE